jgi:hypothetical protein
MIRIYLSLQNQWLAVSKMIYSRIINQDAARAVVMFNPNFDREFEEASREAYDRYDKGITDEEPEVAEIALHLHERALHQRSLESQLVRSHDLQALHQAIICYRVLAASERCSEDLDQFDRLAPLVFIARHFLRQLYSQHQALVPTAKHTRSPMAAYGDTDAAVA